MVSAPDRLIAVYLLRSYKLTNPACFDMRPYLSQHNVSPRITCAVSTVTLIIAGCLAVPGETLLSGSRQREVRDRVLAAAKSAKPECRLQKVTDTEIAELHGDGKVALERWTVEQCGEKVRYRVSQPPTGRGTGFLVHPEK